MQNKKVTVIANYFVQSGSNSKIVQIARARCESRPAVGSSGLNAQEQAIELKF